MKLFQRFNNDRINRSTFLIGSLIGITTLVIPLLNIFSIIYNKDYKRSFILLILLLVVILCLSYIGILGTKRRHDLGLSSEDDPDLFKHFSYRGLLIIGWIYNLLKPGQSRTNT